MRFATIVEDGRASVVLIRDDDVLPLTPLSAGFDSMRDLIAFGDDGLERVRAWARQQPPSAFRSVDEVDIGPAVPEPGAIYTFGLNYSSPGSPDASRPPRPLVYAKLPSAVAGDDSVLTWDRSLTANVDPEAELGVVIGRTAVSVATADAMRYVFGYTCINDISSRDAWLDGDQWLLGKSMVGFCPVGPAVVTRDEVDPEHLRLGCTLNGVAIQAGSTDQMHFSIPEQIAYLSRHVALQPGDLIATGTPVRLEGPPGPDRHLLAGDVVTVWVEHIGELTTTIT